MAIKTGVDLKTDIYIDYPFENVMFRREYKTGFIYKKFYGEKEIPILVHYTNRLYNDALRWGDEITKEKYIRGKLLDE